MDYCLYAIPPMVTSFVGTGRDYSLDLILILHFSAHITVARFLFLDRYSRIENHIPPQMRHHQEILWSCSSQLPTVSNGLSEREGVVLSYFVGECSCSRRVSKH